MLAEDIPGHRHRALGSPAPALTSQQARLDPVREFATVFQVRRGTALTPHPEHQLGWWRERSVNPTRQDAFNPVPAALCLPLPCKPCASWVHARNPHTRIINYSSADRQWEATDEKHILFVSKSPTDVRVPRAHEVFVLERRFPARPSTKPDKPQHCRLAVGGRGHKPHRKHTAEQNREIVGRNAQ